MVALQTPAIEGSQSVPQIKIVPLVEGFYPVDVIEGAGYRNTAMGQRDV